MTAHDHSTHVEGCFRCELSKDEVAGADRVLLDVDTGHRYIAVDYLLSEEFASRVLTAHLSSQAAGMVDAQHDGIRRAVELTLEHNPETEASRD